MNTKNRLLISTITFYLMAFCLPVFAHDKPSPEINCPNPNVKKPGVSAQEIIRPQSDLESPQDPGIRAHTHMRMLIPQGGIQEFNANIKVKKAAAGGPPTAGSFFETPASLGCLYGLTPPVVGCNPNTVTANPIGGSRVIAIVDAYN